MTELLTGHKRWAVGAIFFVISLIALAWLLHHQPITAGNASVSPVQKKGKIAATPRIRLRRHRLALPFEAAPKPKLADGAELENMNMNLRRFGLHQYLINFAGIATYQGLPCPNASILIRISAGDASQTVGLITKTDGSYTTQILVDSIPNQPIDWIVEGFTPEFKKVQIVGRRIGTNDDDPIGIEQAVAFAAPRDNQPQLDIQ